MNFKQVMHPELYRYLFSQRNFADGYCTDAGYRFLLPMDTVTSSYKTDEGPEVFINSTVKIIITDNVIVTTGNYAFNIAPHIVKAAKCIKHPTDHKILYLFTQFITGFNGQLLLNRKLHINGIRLCFNPF